MVARLQGYIGRAAAQALARVLLCDFESSDLSVVELVVLMPALANHLPSTIQNHAAHSRVRRSHANSAPSQLKRSLHPNPIEFHLCGHTWLKE
jgi:hypothetical protein